MSTTPPPVPMTPDAAYQAFQQAEGTLKTDLAAQTNAQAALASAQTNADSANTQVSADSAASKAAAQNVITALQAYIDALPPTPPAAPNPTPGV